MDRNFEQIKQGPDYEELIGPSRLGNLVLDVLDEAAYATGLTLMMAQVILEKAFGLTHNAEEKERKRNRKNPYYPAYKEPSPRRWSK